MKKTMILMLLLTVTLAGQAWGNILGDFVDSFKESPDNKYYDFSCSKPNFVQYTISPNVDQINYFFTGECTCTAEYQGGSAHRITTSKYILSGNWNATTQKATEYVNNNPIATALFESATATIKLDCPADPWVNNLQGCNAQVSGQLWDNNKLREAFSDLVNPPYPKTVWTLPAGVRNTVKLDFEKKLAQKAALKKNIKAEEKKVADNATAATAKAVAPPLPSPDIALSTKNGLVTINWKLTGLPPKVNPANAVVQRKNPGSAQFQDIFPNLGLSSGQTGINDAKVEPGKSYSYRMKWSSNDGRESNWGSEKSITVAKLDIFAPTPPQNLSGQQLSGGLQVKLSWMFDLKFKNNPIKGYKVYRSQYMGKRELIAQIPGTPQASNQYIDTTLKTPNKYDYEVVPYNEAGEAVVNSVSVNVAATAPVSGIKPMMPSGTRR